MLTHRYTSIEVGLSHGLLVSKLCIQDCHDHFIILHLYVTILSSRSLGKAHIICSVMCLPGMSFLMWTPSDSFVICLKYWCAHSVIWLMLTEEWVITEDCLPLITLRMFYVVKNLICPTNVTVKVIDFQYVIELLHHYELFV